RPSHNPALQRPRVERFLLGQAFHHISVVAVIVAGPNPLPSPWCRLPVPARGAIEANAGDERRRGKGEEAAVGEPIEPGERKPNGEPGEANPMYAAGQAQPGPAT